MANQSTCVRCGKPCAAGDIMCSECNQWFQEQTKGKNQSFKKVGRPAPRPAPQPVRDDDRTVSARPAPQPVRDDDRTVSARPAPQPVRDDDRTVSTRPAPQPVRDDDRTVSARPAPQPVQPVGANQKICANCGATISSISRFCPKCGWDQNEVPTGRQEDDPFGRTVSAFGTSRPDPEPQPVQQEPAPAPEPQPPQPQEAQENRAPRPNPVGGKGSAPAKQKKSGGNKLLIPIVAAVALVAVVAVVLVLVLGGKNKKSDPWEDEGGASLSEPAEEQENTGTFVPEFEFTEGTGTVIDETPTEVPAETPEETPAETTPVVACIKCGVAIPGDAQFCPYCGQDQTVPVEPEEPVEITAELMEYPPETEGSTAQLSVSGTNQSSVVVQSGNHNNTAAVVIDGDLSTSWQEGVSGHGIDEWIRLDLASRGYVQYLRLYLGNWRDASWYEKNNVPKVLEIAMGDETFTVEFPYDREEHWVAFSEPVLCDSITFTVKDIYGGSVYDDTCIAEIMIYGYSE